MKRPTPTLDRIALGLVAGAFIGAALLSIGYFILAERWPDISQVLIATTLTFLVCAILLPLTHPPIWFVLRMVLPDWLASTLAGGAAFSFMLVLITVLWSGGYGSGDIELIQLMSWMAIGLAAGLVIWRVTFLQIT
ncbi:MAG: hypothetical protein AB7G40_09315 [Hyphomonadaceae bacterium]